MKYLLSLLFFFLPLSGFEMNIKSGKLQGQKYSLLRLHEPTRPIKCREDIDEYMQVQSVTCKVDRSFARDIEELSHPLFSIDLQKDRASFTLRISSPVKLKLFDKTKPFYQQKEIDYFDTQEANNWLILAYSDKMPYIDKQSATGMGFPIPTDFESLPAVGAVDMDSLPVASRTSDDVNAFADLEKEFEQGNYSTVLQSSKQLLQRYDESIFKSDFLRYKIKAMYHMAPADNFDAIVKDSKRFLREYSSDEYLPEILLLLAKTYDKSGFSGDAKYFYERLIAEHEGSFHAAMGKVEYALFVADNEENADGAKLLEDVFYDTSHMAAAAYAADELVKIYLDRDAIEEALRYVKVIWENDREFYLKQHDRLHTVAKKLAGYDRGLNQAVRMNKALLQRLDKNRDAEYEDVAFEIAKWLDEAGENEKAYGAYEEYLEKFQYGEYAKQAQRRLDILLSKQDDVAFEEKLERLDTLIQTRFDEAIGQSALIAKMQILQDQEQYRDLLDLEEKAQQLEQDRAKNAEEMLANAFDQLVRTYLSSGDCDAFATLYQNSKREISQKRYDNEALYSCYMDAADYNRAYDVAKANTDVQGTEQKALWLCRLGRAALKLNRLDESNAVYSDIIAMEQTQRCEDLYANRFTIADGLDMTDQMVESLDALEEQNSNSVGLLPKYKTLIQKLEDSELKRVYTRRMLELRNKLQTDTFTPWIELQAADTLEADREIVNALQQAVNKDMPQDKLARVYFELGNAYSALGQDREAVSSYEQCQEIDSMWAGICGDSLEMIQN